MNRLANIDTVITTITSGRSGTHYLSALCNTSFNCFMQHEALPTANLVLERFNAGDDQKAARYAGMWSNLKVMDIDWQLAKEDWLKYITIWGDASHVFHRSVTSHKLCVLLSKIECETGHGVASKIVHLRRDCRNVVESHLTHGGGPSDFPSGINYAWLPNHPFVPVEMEWLNWRRHTETKVGKAALCVWEWCMVETAAKQAKCLWGDRVETFELPELNTMAGVERLAAFTGISFNWPDVEQYVINKPRNATKKMGLEKVRLTDDEWTESVDIVRQEVGIEPYDFKGCENFTNAI